MAKVCPLFSGSSGNSYLVQSGNTSILLDAGRSAKQLQEALHHWEVDPKSLAGIFITHEHSDHIKGVRVFASRHHIPVYATSGTLCVMEDMGQLEKVEAHLLPKDGVTTGDIYVQAFPTSHDCAESVGYRIQLPQERTVTLATDLGYLSKAVKEALLGSDCVILESNHDEGMVKNGFYPYPLKQRILSRKGHLSNVACAEFLPTLLEHGTTHFLLSHLSQENNTPELALQTSLCAMQLHGAVEGQDYRMLVAPVENRSKQCILL